MKAIRLTVVGLGIIAAVVLFRQLAHAAEYLNTGNAAGSQNSIDATLQQSTNVNQSNQGSFTNDIDASADTGGNSGESITTGDASVNVTVDNQFNRNQANVPCCPEKSPTPTLKPGQSPSPTPTSGVGGPPSDGGDGDNGNGGGGVGGGGGQVIGLSAAAGENYAEIAITASGIVCLLAGAYLTRKNHLAI